MKNKLDKISISESKGTSKCYVSFADYKRDISARDSKIKVLEKKLEKKDKKEYKMGDEVKYCGLDWIVIKTDPFVIPKFDINNNPIVEEKEIITLMLKNKLNKEQLEACGYTPDNYNDIPFNTDHSDNDWKKSNIRKCVIKFANKYLNVSDLTETQNYYDFNKYSMDCIRVPHLREIEALPKDLRKVDASSGYWTMSASFGTTDTDSYAGVFLVYSSGGLYANGLVSNSYGVRPVITLKAETL